MDAETLTDRRAEGRLFPLGAVDGKVLPAARRHLRSRRAGTVPILAGFNSGEIRSLRFLAPPPPASAAPMRAAIRAAMATWPTLPQALSAKDLRRERCSRPPRDALYGWTAERLAIKQTALGQPSFLYLFDHGYPAAETNMGCTGFHASEIPMSSARPGDAAYWPKIPTRPAERRCRHAMGDYWVSFAKTGAPEAAGEAHGGPMARMRAYMAFADIPRPGARLMPGHVRAARSRRVPPPRPGRIHRGTGTVGIVSPVLAKKCRIAHDRRQHAGVIALTLDKFLDHAAKWHGDAEVVTAREDGASTGRLCDAA
jgi:para-nitrobenzyl esterase